MPPGRTFARAKAKDEVFPAKTVKVETTKHQERVV